MLWSNWSHVPQLLSPGSRAHKAITTESHTLRSYALQKEKSPQREALTLQQERACGKQRRPSAAK